MAIDLSFWKGKKVLITGQTGFKGSWLSLWLKELGAEVIGFSLRTLSSPNMFEVTDLKNTTCSINGNILDLKSLINIINNYQPEIVFHLAAQSLVKYSYDNPVETFTTNVLGSVNVFEAVRQSSDVKVLVNVTSDKCYENRESPYWGLRENDPMGGNDPYSASKGCVELVANSYQNSFFKRGSKVKMASVRAGNVIGGGDWAEDRLIPDIIRSIYSKTPLIIRNPSAVRPWQHVLEPLHGYIILAQKLYSAGTEYTEGWNFGPKDEGVVSVKEILTHFKTHWGEDLTINYKIDENLHEANYLKLDCSKARHLLKWEPKLSIQESVAWTALWYKHYFDGMDMKEFSIKQVNEFMELRR